MEADPGGAQGVLHLVDGGLQIALKVEGLPPVAVRGGLLAGFEGGIRHQLIHGGRARPLPGRALQGRQGAVGLAATHEGLGIGDAQGPVVRIQPHGRLEFADGLVIGAELGVDAGIQDHELRQMRVFLDQVGGEATGLLSLVGAQLGQGQAVGLGGAIADPPRVQVGFEVSDGPFRVFEAEFPQAGAAQVEAQVIGLLLVAIMFGAGQGVRDAVRVDRVGAQKFGGAGVAGMAGFAHPLEEARHGKGIVTRVRQGGNADAVRLLLVVPGEVNLALEGQALNAGDGRHARVGIHLGPQDGGGDHEQGGGDGNLLLVLDGPQQMALADMGDFMGHDRRQFGLGLGSGHQTGEDPDLTVGARKGVDHGLVDEKEGEAASAGLGGGHQPFPQILQIIRQQGIVQHRQGLAHAAHEGLAQLPLLGTGHDGVRGTAEIRQLIGVIRPRTGPG